MGTGGDGWALACGTKDDWLAEYLAERINPGQNAEVSEAVRHPPGQCSQRDYKGKIEQRRGNFDSFQETVDSLRHAYVAAEKEVEHRALGPMWYD